jgi:hypothetical protein
VASEAVAVAVIERVVHGLRVGMSRAELIRDVARMLPVTSPVEGSVNPNSGVLQALEGQWHKLAALILERRLGGRATFTEQEILQFGEAMRGRVVAVDAAGPGALELRIVTDAEAAQMARKHGGRTC